MFIVYISLLFGEFMICPLCKKPLEKKGKSYLCPSAHCFDLAKQGYVNLLSVKEKSSLDPGDNKEMILSRRKVLDRGYYRVIGDKIKEILEKIAPKKVLDLGCGEGRIIRYLLDDKIEFFGVDISKHALQSASALDKKSTYAVASVTSLPFEDGYFDLIINAFAPLKETEGKRVLKEGGYLIKITPAPYHLYQLKEAIYPSPYLNPETEGIEGFTLVEEWILEDVFQASGEVLDSLLQMTPYFYKTPPHLLEKVKGATIATRLSYCLRLYQK